MLTQVEVVSAFNALLELPLSADLIRDNPFQIKDISGIGPVKANINTTPFASSKGEYFSGSSSTKRNIVLTVGCNPNWEDLSMSNLRTDVLYQYFMPEQEIFLRFISTHMPNVIIHGYVESCEVNPFSKDPELQVSVICPQPDFVASLATLVTGATSDGTFANLTEIEYEGNVPTGFDLSITSSVALAAYTGPFLVKNILNILGTQETLEIQPSTLVDSTHTLEIGTVDGNKYVRKLVSGSYTSILSMLTAASVWPKLRNGDNRFGVQTSVSGLTWQMYYFARYGGI